MEWRDYLQILKRYDIPELCCNETVSDIHLEKFTRYNCKQWRSLPSYLHLEDAVAEDIDASNHTEKSKRYEFLYEWKSKKGSSATYKQLIGALLEIHCRRDAEKLSQILKSSLRESSSLQKTRKPLKTRPGKLLNVLG